MNFNELINYLSVATLISGFLLLFVFYLLKR